MCIVSCNNQDDNDIIEQTEVITFIAEIEESNTHERIATDSEFKSRWENGDAIGVYIVEELQDLQANSIGNWGTNIKVTYDSNTKKWTSDIVVYYPNNEKTLSFYAYYPYDEYVSDPNDITFSVNPDQSSSGDFSKSDLLIAKPLTNVAKSHNSVKLDFKHLLALVQMEAYKETSSDLGTSGSMDVTLMQCQSMVNINIVTGIKSVSPSTIIDVAMYETKDADGQNIYRAIVPPQILERGNDIFKIKQFKETYNYANDLNVNLTEGNVSRIVIKQFPFLHKKFITVTGHEFAMGSDNGQPNESPMHKVVLTENFIISRYLITNAQYAIFLNMMGIDETGESYVTSNQNNGVKWNEGKWIPASGKENYPVVNVSWDNANNFANWAGGSLPTEAQWEIACSTGLTPKWPTSSGGDSDLANYAWYNMNSGGSTHAVGLLQPNNWGLYDMLGNVSEWCSNWDYSYEEEIEDSGTGILENPNSGSGTYHVVRGGNYGTDLSESRPTFRRYVNADGSEDIGFRVVFEE